MHLLIIFVILVVVTLWALINDYQSRNLQPSDYFSLGGFGGRIQSRLGKIRFQLRAERFYCDTN